MEPLEPIQLLANIVVNGDAGDNIFGLRLHPDTQNYPDIVQVLVSGVPTHELPRQQIDSLTINAGGGNDWLIVDFTYGNPLRDGALAYNAGGNSGDMLLLLGQSSLTAHIQPSATANRGGSAVLGGREMSFTGVEDIYAGTFQAVSLITPNAEDALAIDSPSAGVNRISGTSGSANLSRLNFANVGKVVLDLGVNDAEAGDDTLSISADGMVATGLNLLKLMAGAGENALSLAGGTTRLWSTVDTGTLDVTVSAGATLVLPAAQRLRELDVRGAQGNPGQVQFPSDANRLLVVESLLLSEFAVIDMGTSDLLIDYSGTSPAADVRNWLIAGYGPNRNWQGQYGIRTSAAASSRGLGYGEVSALSLGGSYQGQTLDSSAVLVKYTRSGDATLNGWVDSVDHSVFSAHWQQSVSGWTEADFNYDGFVDVVDLGMLATGWTAGPQPSMTMTGGSATEEGVEYQLSLSSPATYQLQVLYYDDEGMPYYVWETRDYPPVTWHIFWGDEGLDTENGFDVTAGHYYNTPGEKTIYVFALQVGVYHFAGSQTVTVGNTPAAPSDLSATVVSGHEINLAWTDNSNIEVGYQIEQSPDGENDWVPVAWTDANTVYYSLPGPFAPSSSYYFRVMAFTDSAESGYSNTDDVTTVAWPEAPTGLFAWASSDTQIELAWVDNSGGADIVLERSADGIVWSDVTISDNESATDSGLTPGAAYQYRVFACNSNGESGYAFLHVAALARPTLDSVTAVSGHQVDIDWTDNSDYEWGYLVEVSLNGVDGWEPAGFANAEETSVSAEGPFAPSTTYHFRVRGYADGVGPASGIVSATTPAVPNAPTALTADSITNTSLNLSWQDNDTAEDGYTLQRSTDGVNWTTFPLDPDTTEDEQTGLSEGTTYYYRVFATNAAGESGYGSTYVTTLLPGPSSFAASETATHHIVLTWVDESANESGFNIEQSVDGEDWFPAGEAEANAGSLMLPGPFEAGSTHYFRAAAHSDYAISDYSSVVGLTISDYPNAPSDLVLTPISPTRIDLSWTDNDAGNAFRVVRTPEGGQPVTFGASAYQTSFSDIGLTECTLYTYEVFAYNGTTQSISVSGVSLTMPLAPTGLSAEVIGARRIDLAWISHSEASLGVEIERSENGGDFELIGWAEGAATSFSDMDVRPGTSYRYRIMACGFGSHSDYVGPTSALDTGDEVELVIDASSTGPYSEGDTFSIELSAIGIEPRKWLIDWGDGITQVLAGTATYAEHVYAQNGMFEVVASVIDGDQTFESEALNAGIGNVAPLGVSISGRSTLIAGSAYRLDLSASDPGADGIGWEIDWGDGQSTNLSPSSYERPWVAGHVYAGAGPYLIQATALDEDGGRTQASSIVAGELAAPINLSATAVSASQINLTWTDNSSGELGFRIDTSTDGSNYRTAAIAAPNATSYSLTALASGTLHYVRVSAFGAYGASSYASASATTSGDAIAAPQNLDYWHQTDFLLGMTWEASPDAEFQVQARPLAYPHPAGGSDWMPMSGITMYDEWEEYWSWYGNMMHPSDHEYRLRAVDGGAYSDWVYLSVDGAPSYDLPGRPCGLAASSVTSSSFTVTWEPVEDAMYQVALVEPGSMRHPYNLTWSTGTVQYVYSEPWQATFSNLQAGRTYQVVVMSISTWHGSFYSNESAMLQVRTAPSPAGAPAAPSDLQVRPKDDLSGIELRWLDNSNDETGFTIARSGGGTAYFYPSANQISYLDTTAQPGVSYTYWVLARNAYGNSSWSNSAGASIVLPTVRIEADIAGASETAGDPGQFVITREGGSLAIRYPLQIQFNTSGTAEEGSDYATLTKTRAVLPGQSGVFVQVNPLLDTIAEFPETVIATLTQRPDYQIGTPAWATITIASDMLDAYRTGLKFGEKVPEWIEDSADPTMYLVLTNNDFEEGGAYRDFHDDEAILDGSDDDMGRIRIGQLPPGLATGTVSIELSNSSAVALFKDDGSLFYREGVTSPGALVLDLADPQGYLSGLSSAPLDIWFEGLEKDEDFVFSVVFRDSMEQELGRDDVHVLIAEWTFRDIEDAEMCAAAPLWKDALIAAAEDGAWTESIDTGGGPSGSFFRIQIDGLPFDSQNSIKVTSDAYPGDYYYDDFDETLSGMTRSLDFGVLYNADVYLPPDDEPLSPTERALIKSNLMLNAVHNAGATTKLTTPTDEQERQVLAYLPAVFDGIDHDLLMEGSTISGSAKFAVDDWQKYTVHVKLYRDGAFVGQTDFFDRQSDQPFEFTLTDPGRYRLEATGWREGGDGPVWAEAAVHILVDNEVFSSQYKRQAWEALRVDGAGTVPLEAVQRNRRITELYAEAYNVNEDIKYLGMAAFASKLVGDALASAATGGQLLGLYNLVGLIAELAGKDFPWNLPLVGDTRQLASTIYEAYDLLAAGNWAIYMSLYPTFLAYVDDGIQAVRDMEPDEPLLAAWEKLDEGRTANPKDEDKIWEAAQLMVHYEQTVVLQNAIADTQQKRDFWTSFSQNHGHRIRSPFPGAQTFKQFNPNGDYGNADHRMQWFNQELYPKAKQWLENHPNGIDVETLLEGGYGT
jgi:fibronectin type 3 domain-containing protein